MEWNGKQGCLFKFVPNNNQRKQYIITAAQPPSQATTHFCVLSQIFAQWMYLSNKGERINLPMIFYHITT
jgi:hypothetical protein